MSLSKRSFALTILFVLIRKIEGRILRKCPKPGASWALNKMLLSQHAPETCHHSLILKSMDVLDFKPLKTTQK